MNELTAIVDGNNILLRSRAALRDLQTKAGVPTAGVYGSILTLGHLQKQFDFSDMIWVFDWGRSFFRKAVRSTYKENRLTVERDDAAPQFKLLEEFLGLIKVPFVRVEGIEGDDIIASLAHQIKTDKIIVSGDHDLLQLCDEHTVIAKPSVGKGAEALVDAADVLSKYGLPPDRLAELWALQGEPGDGIAGIPKVGPKTALKILLEHGTIWDAILNEPKCVGYGTHVLENYMMIDLVHGSNGITIENRFDTKFDPTYYPEELRDFFIRLEMHSLVRRFDQGSLWHVAQ